MTIDSRLHFCYSTKEKFEEGNQDPDWCYERPKNLFKLRAIDDDEAWSDTPALARHLRECMLEGLRTGQEGRMVVEIIHRDNHRRENGKPASFFALVQLPSDKAFSPRIVSKAAYEMHFHIRGLLLEPNFKSLWKSGIMLDNKYNSVSKYLRKEYPSMYPLASC